MQRPVSQPGLLRTTGAVAVAGTAGCLDGGLFSGDGGDGSRPADEFEESLTEFVAADGTEFVDDGDRIRSSGANTCCFYTAFTEQGQHRRDVVDELLGDAATLGINALRIRAHGRHKEFAFQSASAEYDEEALELLDYLLYRADQEGVRLIPRFTDSWDTSEATVPQYVEWFDTADSHDDFFTDVRCKELYRDYIEYLLTRENT